MINVNGKVMKLFLLNLLGTLIYLTFCSIFQTSILSTTRNLQEALDKLEQKDLLSSRLNKEVILKSIPLMCDGKSNVNLIGGRKYRGTPD